MRARAPGGNTQFWIPPRARVIVRPMYIVTGGAGFIGSIILRALEAAGQGPLVCCDRIDPAKRPNITKRTLAATPPPEDLTGFLRGHAGQVKAVIHMGAISATTAPDDDHLHNTNVRLPMALWTWCAENQTRFIYASSASVYGAGEHGFEDDISPAALEKLKPLNPYGRSKLAFDIWAAGQAAKGAAPPGWAGLRFFNVYGPNEYHKGGQQSVIAHLVPQIQSTGRARLFQSHRDDVPDGGQSRDFIHADDCAALVLWLLDNPGVSGVFNCGTGKARSFADLAAAVFAAMGREPATDYIPTPEALREKYQYFTQADTRALRAAGFARPFTALENGVADYVRNHLLAEDKYA
ncbi:MAG: ADP-glyceromanno-heptose 6-epimerase [Rhodospirillales bacterium]